LGATGVFLGNIFFQGQKGQKKISANLDFTTTMWEVFNVLQNSSYCNSTTNLVFKEKTAPGVLGRAKLSSEDTPSTNTVNWIGYRVGTNAAALDIKVLEEGDVIENTLTISNITFERQMSDATTPQIVSAAANTPSPGKTTHDVNLVITANPSSGSGFPVTKSFKLKLITDTQTNEIVGCASGLNSAVQSDQKVLLGTVDDCSRGGGTFSGGICSKPWERNITFSPSFSSVPHVLVSASDVSQQGGCVGGTTDKVVAYAKNITPIGFTLVCAGSPNSTCGSFEGQYSAAECSWIAVGGMDTLVGAPSPGPNYTPSVRRVECNMNQSGGTSCQADCAADEYVIGGGFSWGAVVSSFGKNSYPNSNGWYCQVNIQSCTSGSPSTGCGSRCFAICLKKT
ncbi:hypothetical protein EBR78_10475, partial [bacterium]|nr:hypothetical protein [bacterium]